VRLLQYILAICLSIILIHSNFNCKTTNQIELVRFYSVLDTSKIDGSTREDSGHKRRNGQDPDQQGY
jgi:hypothetical protein